MDKKDKIAEIGKNFWDCTFEVMATSFFVLKSKHWFCNAFTFIPKIADEKKVKSISKYNYYENTSQFYLTV